MPIERTNAVLGTRRFLRALLHKQLWQEEFPGRPWPFPRVRPPLSLFEMVRSLLKHYPDEWALTQKRREDPDTWGEPKTNDK